MKKIPETFELNEEDIKEAIAFWLNNEHSDGEYESDFEITFASETSRVGSRGMDDGETKTVITAKATKE